MATDRFGWSNSYIGFDTRPADIEFCKREIESIHPNFKFFHIDAANGRYNPGGPVRGQDVVFPADDKSIDFVFATSVFTHMLRDETTRYVREAARVLLQVGVFFSTWAILDNVSEAQISAGDARSKFPYAMPDGTRVDDIDDPTKSVTHTIESVGDMFKNAGLTFGHFRGSWTGLPGFHGQDILIADAT